MAHVHPMVSSCTDCPASVLELFLVCDDRHSGVQKVLKSAGMIEVHVAQYDCLDIFDIISGGLDGVRQFMLFVVRRAREQISRRGPPFL